MPSYAPDECSYHIKQYVYLAIKLNSIKLKIINPTYILTSNIASNTMQSPENELVMLQVLYNELTIGLAAITDV